jgi:hypothetical protein
MIPASIRSNLAGLRRRERLIRFAWGACCWLALGIALLFLCALTDFLIDRDRDTPWSVRYLLFGMQVVVAAAAAVGFLLWPQMKRLRDSELALWVESHASRLGHRLITAVELNQPGAQTEGMSEELIVVVTQEAEQLTAPMQFSHIADHRRFVWGLAVVVPVLLIALVPVLLWPQLSLTLLERQALYDVDVPRLVHLASDTPPVLPIGERFDLVYKVSGPVDENSVGEVVVAPEGQPRDRYELTYWKGLPDGAALFKVAMPASTIDFTYSARLGDGRTRKADQVRFVARPVVTQQEAIVLLPAFCGTTADGRRYEQAQQGHGDVVGIDGSSVRVAIQTSKPVKTAHLEILGPEHFDPSKSDDEQGPERVQRTVPMKVGAAGDSAAAMFDLRREESAYRIVVGDEHGFVNVPPPRRSLRLVPEEPPQVTMLKDYFGPEADSDVEGIPVPIGQPIRIPYVAHGPYGLGQARILYRVVKQQESGKEAVDPGPWTILPLPEVTGRESLGRFDPKRGVFGKSQDKDEVPFHAVPSDNPQLLGRQIGGGRVFLQTAGLVDAKGKPLTLHKGDQVEYCVEVFADKDINKGRPSATSETRVTTVVDQGEWYRWLSAVLREEEQLRRLDQAQRGVFDK